MEIYKTEHGYHLKMCDDSTFAFSDWENDRVGVTLYLGKSFSGSLNFEQATEFYKAWRAMQCK